MPRPDFVTLSAAPSATFSYLIRIIGYTLVFLLIREITRPTRLDWPWVTFAPLIGIGLWQATLGQSQIAEGTAIAVGTYANRNHFAGLLEMILPGTVACGVALVKGDAIRPPSFFRTLCGCALFLGATGMFVAVVSSQSKMGFLATLFGLFAMGALALHGNLRARRKWIALAGLTALFLGAFVLFPSDEAIKGFGGAVEDSTGEARIPIAADTLHLIAAYPLFGSGLGTYGSSFIKYQTSVNDVAFTNAHDDYLQLFAELGIVGFVLLACCAAPIALEAFRTATTETEPNIRYLALGCLGGMAAIGLHSFTDFNLYLPANAMVLVWIAAIAAGLVPAGESVARPTAKRFPLRGVSLALSGVLVIYAAGGLVFEFKLKGDRKAEAWFCRFGICNINSVLAAESTAKAGNFATASQSTLLEAVRRNPASPERWAELGESMLHSEQNTQAAQCYLNALSLGPNDPPLLMRAADFYQSTGDKSRALQLISHALAHTEIYVTPIFDWLAINQVPTEEILARVLPEEPRFVLAYLRQLKNADDAPGAAQVWNAALKRRYLDDPTARDYVNWLYGRKEYHSAATAWAAYLGDRSPAYLKDNWVFNGDFESEISPVALDWSINPSDGIQVELDPDIKHSGKYSLRIRLTGKQNVTSLPVTERAVVTPGRYHFEAYVKTDDLTTDQGISPQVSYAEGVAPLTLTKQPLIGTNDWRKISADLCVKPPTKLVGFGLSRQPSLKFDNLIKGTLWLDSVSLSKLSPNCTR